MNKTALKSEAKHSLSLLGQREVLLVLMAILLLLLFVALLG